MSTTDRPWWENAACAGMAGSAGSPWDVGDGHDTGGMHAALMVCATCPVIVECDADARKGRVQGVIMGGVVYGSPRHGSRRALPSKPCAAAGCANLLPPPTHGGRRLWCSPYCADRAARARARDRVAS